MPRDSVGVRIRTSAIMVTSGAVKDIGEMKEKIFLSAVTAQFKECRDVLRSDLAAVGADVVVQEDFQPHGGTLLL